MNDHYNGLNYRMFGNGHPILFLHGFLESSTMWEVLNLSQLNCCCILVDIPGHGKSELHNEDDDAPSIAFFAHEINALMLHLKIQKYDIVGHSMGGYIGLEMMQLNSKIGKLLLLNSNFWEDTEAKKKDRIAVAELVWKSKNLFLKTAIPNLFFDAKSHSLEIKSLIEEAELISPLAIAYASLAMRNRLNFTSFVQEFPHRIKVIQGVNDGIVKMEHMQEMLPDEVEISYLENCGHMSHMEQTDAVLLCLLEFTA